MSPFAVIFHSIIGSVLALVSLNTLLNLFLIRRIPRGQPATTPLVSILVPARNEARRIVACLGSLAAQDYPKFEVIVLDDNSDDATARLAQEIGFGDSGKLRIIRGAPLPKGWIGKPWACHQLAQAARGDYLLFTDADTVHETAMLAGTIAFALRERTTLLSLWPLQITKTWSEKCVVSLIYLAGVGFMPHALILLAQRWPGLAARLPAKFLRGLGAANGQFILFEREAYFAIGGHAAVSHHLVEDVALGRLVSVGLGEGYRLINADGSLLVRCRMYESFGELWEGFTKNCRAVFEDSLATFLIFGAGQFATFFLPFVLLFRPRPERTIALMEVVTIYALRFLIAARFGSSWLGALLHPVGEILAAMIGLNSWRKSAGAGVAWKGRTYEVVHRPQG